MILVGSAGWSLRSEYKEYFPSIGTHLERYASQFNAVEINSCFYRSHKSQTYAKWASLVPENFRFSVKMIKTITHESGLQNCEPQLAKYVDEVRELGTNLGAILVQLPPRLNFSLATVKAFFAELRRHYDGAVVCEPRHLSWFAIEAEQVLKDFKIGRVAADPALVPSAAEVGGNLDICYYRLHGSPNMYYSNYDHAFLERLAGQIRSQCVYRDVWCIFDNTALGYATANALSMSERLGVSRNSHARSQFTANFVERGSREEQSPL